MTSPAQTLSAQDAIIYLMVTASAADGEIADAELKAIGRVVQSFPVFSPADAETLVQTAGACGDLMSSEGGLQKVLDVAKASIPSHLTETAYAAVVEVTAADEGLTMSELRILDLVRQALEISDEGASAIERATRARHMTIDTVE
ncbi:MAG: tellurite resistance TerB family protein [Pseudomonadota bacterium]